MNVNVVVLVTVTTPGTEVGPSVGAVELSSVVLVEEESVEEDSVGFPE